MTPGRVAQTPVLWSGASACICEVPVQSALFGVRVGEDGAELPWLIPAPRCPVPLPGTWFEFSWMVQFPAGQRLSLQLLCTFVWTETQ